MAGQYWVRVVGFLQPPPAREVLSPSGYFRGDERAAHRMPVGEISLPPIPASRTPEAGRATAQAVAERPAALEITNGDRLIYLALGPFSLYAVGTVTSDPEPAPNDPRKRVVSVHTDVFINTVMKTPHFGGVALPSGRDLRLLVQQYTYIWVSPEDGESLVQRVSTKAGAKD
ncbi:MAG TPA: hypothetical protein VK066_28730 [Chloroflexota bacterium]|nr:hypothetical protein [Chloroflexota bacterium]